MVIWFLILKFTCYKKKKEEEKSKKYLDFFYESRHGICNKELLNLWKRKILIFPRNILEPINILLKKIYSTNNIHTVSGFNDKVRDINCYFDNQEPSFILSTLYNPFGRKI